jgi:hypothetical protein
MAVSNVGAELKTGCALFQYTHLDIVPDFRNADFFQYVYMYVYIYIYISTLPIYCCYYFLHSRYLTAPFS